MAEVVDRLLGRLANVKRTGAGRWSACCPAHASRSQSSLSIREIDDGRVLLHCFAGCPVDDVVRAVGLDLTDLYPPRTDEDRRPRERRPFLASDAIRALRRELHVAWLVLSDVAAGKPLSDLDRKRAGIARDRCVALIAELADD